MDTERSFDRFSSGNRYSYGFKSIVPIWIGVRRLPAHPSKAIEHLFESRHPVFTSTCATGSRVCRERNRFRHADWIWIPFHVIPGRSKKRSQVKPQSHCFAVSKKQKQNGIQAFPSSKSTGYLRHSRGFCRVRLSRTCKGPSLAS